MFTGDKKQIALEIGKKLDIDEIKYEMLPTDKFENYEKVAKNQEITIFVGDGINDAPVLKRSDIGISMGNIGTDSAIEASDIVIMKDDLEKIPLAINISKYTKHNKTKLNICNHSKIINTTTKHIWVSKHVVCRIRRHWSNIINYNKHSKNH